MFHAERPLVVFFGREIFGGRPAGEDGMFHVERFTYISGKTNDVQFKWEVLAEDSGQK